MKRDWVTGVLPLGGISIALSPGIPIRPPSRVTVRENTWLLLRLCGFLSDNTDTPSHVHSHHNAIHHVTWLSQCWALWTFSFQICELVL